tara:strand:+ start:2273 stop:2473 length:201 start_codon:yes stop_codon:yes gene_type:complete
MTFEALCAKALNNAQAAHDDIRREVNLAMTDGSITRRQVLAQVAASAAIVELDAAIATLKVYENVP